MLVISYLQRWDNTQTAVRLDIRSHKNSNAMYQPVKFNKKVSTKQGNEKYLILLLLKDKLTYSIYIMIAYLFDQTYYVF
jgi:hypothetical protein